jgi:Zn-dependent protease/predicted transcriptional regulator
MRWSLSLGKPFGIRLEVHWTFVLIIVWVVYLQMKQDAPTDSILLTVLFVLTIFACVVLHELGHALTARRYGIPTKKITLLPIGGVASLERMPEEPKQELFIAVMGPAVNVAIAALLLLVFGFGEMPTQEELIGGMTPKLFVQQLILVNILLVVFNAIPAFPMDGGRVLRALLAMRIGRQRATQVASNLGQLFAIAFVILGFYYNPFLIFIGLFVFLGAYAENHMVQQTELLRGHLVRDAMITQYLTLNPDDTLRQAADALLAGSDTDFVVVQNGEVAGLLSRSALIDGLKAKGREASVAEVMEEQFPFASPEDKLTKIYPALMGGKQNFMPVLEGTRLIGVINRDNLSEFLMLQSAYR